jgi:photosystem II stability/assembly factor-like uncharacterized protein
MRLEMSPKNPLRLYADGEKIGKLKGRPFWTDDGGKTWNPSESREETIGSMEIAGYWAEGIAVDPFNEMIAYYFHPMYKTLDGGKKWIFKGNGISGYRFGRQTSIGFSEDKKTMIFFYIDQGVVITDDDCDTVRPGRAGRYKYIQTVHCGALDPLSKNQRIVADLGKWTENIIILTEDGGKTWTQILGTEGSYDFFAYHPQKPNIVYAGGKHYEELGVVKKNKGSIISRDGGKTWTELIKERKIVAIHNGNGDIVYSIKDLGEYKYTVERSDDQGKTWRMLSGYVLEDSTEQFIQHEIAIDSKNPDRVYFAGTSGFYIHDGKEWRRLDEKSGLTPNIIGKMCYNRVAVDPRYPNIVYTGQNLSWHCGVSTGIFRSKDYGEHWEDISGNFIKTSVWSIIVSPYDSTVYVGTDLGTWRLRGGR